MKKTKPASQELSNSPLKTDGEIRRAQTTEPEPPTVLDEASLLADLRALIPSARQRVATVANATQTLLYWHMGRRLLKDNLQDGRAAYGKRILATVSQELCAEFGEGFTLRSLYRSVQFFELFPDETIVSALSAQLSWSHFIALLPLKDPLTRDFYAEMCRIERWDVRTLRQKIGGMLFQRTALSKNIKAVIASEIANLRNGRMTPDTVFRDPYFLDFLGLKVVGADGTQILTAKKGHCARFHAFQLECSGIPTTGYNRHFKFLKERTFPAPSLPEQTAIAAVLSDMDAEIAALEARRDKTRALKQGMMQELLTGRTRLV